MKDLEWLQKFLHDPAIGVFGDKYAAYWLSALFWSAFGQMLSLYVSSRRRNPLSSNTPKKFSWLFLIWDNLPRAIVTQALAFLFFRVLDITTIWQMLGIGIGVVIGFDQILDLLMQKSEWLSNLLRMNRDKFPQKPSE